MNWRYGSLAAALVIATAAWLGPVSEADACGGFFCNNASPVNQAAERIIFANNPDGSMTAVVQILYEGPADQFAWVLPVPSVPEVGVSSNLAFTRIQNRTNPTYTLNRQVEGECKEEEFQAANDVNNSNNINNANNFNNANNGGGVVVLASGAVGPYDYEVIEVTGNPEAPEQLAIDWLESNNYDVGALAPDLIAEYIAKDSKLVAFKLSKDKSVGDIRPVTLRYESDMPCIPIKLTAVAANDDMGVLVWVLGPDRAVPVNYRDLVLNDALINWFNPNSTYNDVVNAAADESGGQGFVTEMAESTAVMDGVVLNEFEDADWNDLKTAPIEGYEWFYRAYNLFAFGGFDPVTFEDIAWDGLQDALTVIFMDLPEEDLQRLFNEGPWIFDPEFGDLTFPEDFDKGLAIMTLDDLVFEPMANTQKIFEENAFMSRMYTTMSAADMTLDPLFDFNPDLETFSNAHTAEYIIECNPEIFQFEAPYRVELDHGIVVRGKEQNVWPIDASFELPFNAQIRQQSTSGPPEIITDNTRTIREALEAHNGTVPTGDELGAKATGGCSSTGSSQGGLIVLLLGFFVAVRRRRI